MIGQFAAAAAAVWLARAHAVQHMTLPQDCIRRAIPSVDRSPTGSAGSDVDGLLSKCFKLDGERKEGNWTHILNRSGRPMYIYS